MATAFFNQGVNVLAFKKNNIRYAATYAWFSQVGYEEIIGLMGAQSDTAHAIDVGDIVGLSALEKSQMDIANILGENHSTKTDKLASVKTQECGPAILIKDSKVMMIVEIKEILHLDGIKDDYLVYGHVKEVQTNPGNFLNMSDFE